jgi:hypothetical protein
MHPDLLPTDADLDDPLGFREDATALPELSAEDFDAELAKLLNRPEPPDAPDSPDSPDSPEE